MTVQKRRNMTIITVMLAAALFTIWIISIISGAGTGKAMGTEDVLTVDENAREWSADLPDDGKSGIKIPGYGDIYFSSGETEMPVTLYNPKENDCLFAFELYIENESAPSAVTGLIEPGTAVTQIALENPLSAGTYGLMIKVNTFDRDTGTKLNNAVVKTRLIVI